MNTAARMLRRSCSPRPADSRRGGFTLVEMLVSTALVLLIMVLFAQIYGAAVGTLREQEGLAKNDAKARAVVTMLRNDLTARSYRELPLAISDPNKADLVVRGLVAIHPRCLSIAETQKGFFYISENDPADDSDDVLSFTTFLQQEASYFTGRIVKGGNLPNHPDSDDAVQDDGVTASRAAVVTYFLREGKLHRRVHLLRDPLVIPNPYSADARNSGAVMALPTQPSDEAIGNLNQLGTGNLLNLGTTANWYETNAVAIQANPVATTRVRVLGIDTLDNTQVLANAPIGLPRNREGHASSGNPTGEFSGANFQGRVALSGERFGEDVVLANVIGFDVKAWEPQDANINLTADPFEGTSRGGRFVDIGHGILAQPNGSAESTETGPFRLTVPGSAMNENTTWGKLNSSYSTAGPVATRVFDTWHPLRPNGSLPDPPPAALNADAVPPYYPLKIAPSAANTTWTANAARNANATDWTQSDIYFPWAAFGDFSVGYRVKQGGSGTTNTAREPVWSRLIGNEVADGTVTWECFDNRVGLQALRVVVRFVDPGSSLIRQVTLDHSFLD